MTSLLDVLFVIKEGPKLIPTPLPSTYLFVQLGLGLWPAITPACVRGSSGKGPERRTKPFLLSLPWSGKGSVGDRISLVLCGSLSRLCQ